jgi:hypothetical protein
MGLPTILACIRYEQRELQMVRIIFTSSDSIQFDTAFIYPTLALDIQYDFSVN